MRLKSLLIAGFGLLTLAISSPEPASAFHWDRPDQPRGWDNMRTVRHWVYYPRYNHVYLRHGATDPYGYSYRPRGYYPYYNSNYWRPAYKVRRHRHHLPPYYAAWGSPKRGYRHVEWHRRNHGGHRRGHW
jgi:hypothetical protein